MARISFVLALLGVIVLGTKMVSGQDYPNKPIRIVTSAAGGSGDFSSRIIAQGISSTLGFPVTVDNRAGPSLSAEAVAKAPPDGYTFLINGASVWIGPLLQNMPYDPVRDFSPISLIERTAFIVAVHPSVPVKNIKELIALAKAKPGVLNYGASAVGGSSHLAAALFSSMANVNIVRVSYKGTAPAVTALISGEVQLMILDTGPIAPHVKSGRLRALAITSAQPSSLFPGLATVATSGLPGYEAVGMTGSYLPAKTPMVIISRLNQEIVRVLNRPDVKERYLNIGSDVVGSSPEEFAAIIKADLARMEKVIKEAGIKVD